MLQCQIKKSFNTLKLTNKFRCVSAILISIITIIIILSFMWLLHNIVDNISKDYAILYADNAVKTMNTYLNSDIALMRKTANSEAMLEWFKDENNQEKKLEAFKEMQNTMKASINKNFYIGINKTLSEIPIELSMKINEIQPVATLSPYLPKDDWYFECIENEKEYLLNVDVDKVYHRKRAWLNYKVEENGKVLGSIATALEFSELVENIFANYTDNGVRSFIIDETGIIQMDSDLIGDEQFLVSLEHQKNISDILDDPEFKHTIAQYTQENLDNYTSNSITTVLELASEKYGYATFAPIENSTWTVVTLYNPSALFESTQILPLFIIILLASIMFMIALTRAVSVFILDPFRKLAASMDRVDGNLNEQIAGTDMNDEIGQLARSIQKMKDNLIDALGKTNYDGLTGVFNRRYLDETITTIFETLSKSNSPIGLIMVDIDYFKKYNDTYGHLQGDECLKTVANILSSVLNNYDGFVARYSGEEFIIVLSNANKDAILLIANRILSTLKASNLPHRTSEIKPYLTVSMGIVSSVPVADVHYTQYIQCADEALYESKQNGRNQYTIKTFHVEKCSLLAKN